MANLMHSARLLVSDLASTLLFLVVLLITKDLMLAVALGMALGIVQIGWMKLRRQKHRHHAVAEHRPGRGLRHGHHADQRCALRDAEAHASSTASSVPTCCSRAG